MRNWLLAIAISGNVAVWGIAYIGFTREDGARAEHTLRNRPVYLEMFTLLAPTQTYSGQVLRRTPLTITLQLVDPAKVREVCQYSPRIRAAILQLMFRQPVMVDADRRMDLQSIRPYMLATVNRAIGTSMVGAVLVDEGPAEGERPKKPRYADTIDCTTLAIQDAQKKVAPERKRGELYVPFGRIIR